MVNKVNTRRKRINRQGGEATFCPCYLSSLSFNHSSFHVSLSIPLSLPLSQLPLYSSWKSIRYRPGQQITSNVYWKKSHNETLPYCRLYQTSDPRRDLHGTNHKNFSTGITSFRFAIVALRLRTSLEHWKGDRSVLCEGKLNNIAI